MVTDINKIEKHIQELIDSGKIKNEEEIKNIPIDIFVLKTLCVIIATRNIMGNVLSLIATNYKIS